MNYGRPAAALGVLATTLIPLSFPAHGGPTGFDTRVTSWVRSTFTDESVNRVLLWPSNMVLLAVLLLIGAFMFRRSRSRWQVGALVAGPVLAVLLTEVLLKPAFGRHLYSPYNHRTFLDYPSGNAVALAATVTAFALIAATRRARAAIIAVGVVAMAAVAVGLIWFSYHYPTDVIGGICFGACVPLALATFRGESAG